jgi:hypothetical protein
MPKRIITIGVLFVVCGLFAIWSVLSGLANNRINLNFAVLMLPVGVGLLRGKRSSQWWARFWIILGYCMMGLLVMLAFAMPHNVNATWFGNRIRGPSAIPYVIFVAIVFTAVLNVVHRLLYSEKSNAYFNRLP